MSEKEQWINAIRNNSSETIANLILADIERQKEKDKEIKRLNNIINELEKEIDRLLERQYASERFAKEQGFDTYLPAKENLLFVKNKLQELKGSKDNER